MSIEQILEAIRESCIEIYSVLHSHTFEELARCVDRKNESGDDVSFIDQKANHILLSNLKSIPTIHSIISEEVNESLKLNVSGKYIVALDPIDGSSNIGQNISTGTIFGIYNVKGDIKLGGYCMYGTSCVFITGSYKKVTCWRLQHNKFIEYKPKLESKQIVSINSSKKHNCGRLLEDLYKCGYTHRYIGSFVADAHRTIFSGGVFMYPSSQNSRKGKLRLLYETKPMSLILCAMDGHAVNDKNESILSLPFDRTNIHECTPFYMFHKDSINFVRRSYL